MEFFDTIKQIQLNQYPYKKWENEQWKKDKQNEELRKKYPPTSQELEHAKQFGKTIVNVINTMDQHSIDKSEDTSVALGYKLIPLNSALMLSSWVAGSALGKKLVKSTKFEYLKPYYGLIGCIVTTAVAVPIINIWQSKKTKEASRIARFQTRENELKDSRNFVIYNNQQIKEAKKIAENLPDIKEKKKNKFTFNPIKAYKQTKQTTNELEKDADKYRQWEKEYLKEEESKQEKFRNINPSKNDLNKAEKDREGLLNTIKKIEKYSLDYLNNMEMASYVINVAASVTSMTIGAGLTHLIGSLKSKNKAPKNNKASIVGAIPFILSAFAPLVILSPVNTLIKDAARIGRFKAKQELLNNPQNFISYNDEQRKTVNIDETIKQKPKGLWNRFKEDIKALKQLKQDAKEYKTYMDTEHKKELKLQEALKQIEITKEQKSESINLQKKIFHSFEKMDEKAQRFMDDADAAIDSTKIFLASAIGLTVKLASISICGKELKRLNQNKTPKSFLEALKLTVSGNIKGKAIIGVFMPFVLTPVLAMPIAVKGVQLKKDAGKIGIMSAMNDLDDPKNFLDTDKLNFNTYKKNSNTKMFERFKHFKNQESSKT